MRNLFLIAFSSFLAVITTGAGAAPAPSAPLANSVYGAPTVGDFLIACRMDQGGCVDEVGTALMNKMDYSGVSKVCIASPNYGNAVPGWLSAHPATSNMATEDGIYLAIKTLYPCG
jgi:hypothetical protein